jgi:hypothetical protein
LYRSFFLLENSFRSIHRANYSNSFNFVLILFRLFIFISFKVKVFTLNSGIFQMEKSIEKLYDPQPFKVNAKKNKTYFMWEDEFFERK